MVTFNTTAEQKAISSQPNPSLDARVQLDKKDLRLSIPARFEKIVVECPDRTAIKTRKSAISYGELNQQANCLARTLLTLSNIPQEQVALLMGDYVSLGVASVGAVKAGKVCVAIDPSLPIPRIDHILSATKPCVVITDEEGDGVLFSLAISEARLLRIRDLDTQSVIENPSVVIPPNYIADIVFTSGSTGRPKGVIRAHQFLLGKHAERLSLDLSRRGEVRSTSVNASRKAVLTSLLSAASSYPWDIRKEGLNGLANWLKTQQITNFDSTPTVFRYFVDDITKNDQFPDLREIRLSGEVVTNHDVELFKKHFPRPCTLRITLGTTETGSIAEHRIDHDTVLGKSIVHVGFEVPNKKVLLLDNDLQDVGYGRIGKIAVKARFLAAGYWQDPDLTKATFLDDPEGTEQRIYLTGDLGCRAKDGSLEFLGREDDQVKIRGVKVEPAEVVNRLLAHQAVQDGYVLPKKDISGEVRLLAYVVLKEGNRATVSDLTSFLRKVLPDYMIPSTYIFLPVLPLTLNFKVDRALLPVPRANRPELDSEFIAPTTQWEKQLAEIWSEVLSLDPVGIHDNFFDLGGHSLAATRVVSRVLKQFQLEIPLQSLFQSPTIADMAAVITAHQGKALDEQGMATMLDELESLSEEDAKQLLGKRHHDISKA